MRNLSAAAVLAYAAVSPAFAAEERSMFERRLGMFVHWGLYSVGEWHELDFAPGALEGKRR